MCECAKYLSKRLYEVTSESYCTTEIQSISWFSHFQCYSFPKNPGNSYSIEIDPYERVYVRGWYETKELGTRCRRCTENIRRMIGPWIRSCEEFFVAQEPQKQVRSFRTRLNRRLGNVEFVGKRPNIQAGLVDRVLSLFGCLEPIASPALASSLGPAFRKMLLDTFPRKTTIRERLTLGAYGKNYEILGSSYNFPPGLLRSYPGYKKAYLVVYKLRV